MTLTANCAGCATTSARNVAATCRRPPSQPWRSVSGHKRSTPSGTAMPRQMVHRFTASSASTGGSLMGGRLRPLRHRRRATLHIGMPDAEWWLHAG